MARYGQRVGLFMALTMAATLLGAPAHAAGTAKKPKPSTSTSAKADAGVEGKDAGTAATPEKDGGESQGAGRCTGKAHFCGVFSQMYCSSQPGCAYMFGSNMCGGVAIACEKATNEAFCTKIKGCSWK
ncbi:hypothetical protein HJC10_13200 [Corallococcus exiguus]|uniref:hypothetical protein n=1 Tax=Corallococcus TaxID=83461 RepID=UPI000EDF60AA|nr:MULTISPECIES: hypothetical protein [Corallococcus]NNC03799.1 hypothetical protein [Corallococcus exiguus]NPC46364.1 hypothetical protein [Corallococcus exiguus]RKH82438.1 hypothetical protein D7X99_15700 [Corallococcus sp. AB032C]